MSFALKALSLLCAALSALNGVMFYTLYWQWRHLFHNGRYFDQGEGVVYTDDAAFYSVPVVGLALLATLLWRKAKRKTKNNQIYLHAPPIHTRPLWLGVLLAPCITPFCFYIVDVIKNFLVTTPLQQMPQTDEHIATGLLMIYVISAPLVTLVGVPAILCLKKYDLFSWDGICISSSVLATLGGFGIWYAISSQSMTDPASGSLLKNIFWICTACAASGLSIGLIFCSVIGLKPRAKTAMS